MSEGLRTLRAGYRRIDASGQRLQHCIDAQRLWAAMLEWLDQLHEAAKIVESQAGTDVLSTLYIMSRWEWDRCAVSESTPFAGQANEQQECGQATST